MPDILNVTSRCAVSPVCSLSSQLSLSLFFLSLLGRLEQGCPRCKKLDQLFRIHQPSTPYNRRKIIFGFLKSLLSFFCFCPSPAFPSNPFKQIKALCLYPCPCHSFSPASLTFSVCFFWLQKQLRQKVTRTACPGWTFSSYSVLKDDKKRCYTKNHSGLQLSSIVICFTRKGGRDRDGGRGRVVGSAGCRETEKAGRRSVGPRLK